MRVLIACVSSSTTPDGVTRHAINLAASLAQSPEMDEVYLAIGSWQLTFVRALLDERKASCHTVVADCPNSSLKRNLWYLRDLPSLALHLQADLVHLAYPAPIRRTRFPCPVVTTLHDLYPIDAPHNFGYPAVFVNRLILRQCLAAVDAIACVSAGTLARLKLYRREYATKSAHIPNSVRTGCPSPSAPHPSLEHRPFLLTVAQHRRNKDLPLALEAFRLLSHAHPGLLFVIVGNKGPETATVQRLLEDKHLRTRVLLLHGISDRHLQWCYHYCRLLIATSSMEGFGLPIAEAMLAGCPIVCSDIPAFRELGESYCRFVPLGANSAPDFAEAIEQTITLPRPEPRPLAHLSSSAVGDQSLRLYRRLLADRPLNPDLPTLFAPVPKTGPKLR